MSQSPLEETDEPGDDYLDAFRQLSQKIREGLSFSGGERNCAFLNTGAGQFADLSFAFGLDADDDGRGVAVADIDLDGDVDLCLTNRTAPRLRILRNDLVAAPRSVGLYLIGDPAKGCPRDAAGARVTVDVAGRRHHRTVALGSGFCSQSSKWLHVGLGAAGGAPGVVVRWPGGGREPFEGVAGAGRFLLRQGSGVAERLEDAPPPALAEGEPPLPEPTDAGRVRLSQPLKLPSELRYRDFSGAEVRLAELNEPRPILVTFWASWCPPCLGELSEFGAARARFASANVGLLALSVDEIDSGEVPARQLLEVLAEAGYDGASGRADSEFVEVFERLFLEAIYRHRGFPVPTSFLIDKGGWLTVIYKGVVSPDRVLEDASKLGLGPDIARRESTPFDGRWAEGHFESHPLAVARAFQEGGHTGDARAHLEGFLSQHPVPPGTRPDRQRAAQLADVHHFLGEIIAADGDPKAALGHFKAAAHFAPDTGRFRARKILALAQAGDLPQASKEAAEMRRGHPANPHVLALNGDVAMIAGDEKAAAEAFSATLAADPRYIPVLRSLSRLRASARDPSVRDPASAVRLAETLMGAPGAGSDPGILATLGLAYASAGMTEKSEQAFGRARASAARRGGESELRDVEEAAIEADGLGR